MSNPTDYINILQLLDKWLDRFREYLMDMTLLGSEPWTSFLSELQGIRELLDDPAISEPIDNTAIRILSPIDRLGIGQMVISLVEGGMDTEDLAGFLSTKFSTIITSAQVQSWLDEYNNSGISVRTQTLTRDVFDTRSHYQQMLVDIQQQLEELIRKDDEDFRRTSKDEVISQVRSEMRMLLKDARALYKEEAAGQGSQIFTQIALEVIEEMCPEAAPVIFNRLQAHHVSLALGGS